MRRVLSPTPEISDIVEYNWFDKLRMAIANFLSPKRELISPLVNATSVLPTPSPVSSPIDYEAVIRAGFERYGNPPIATMSAKFAEAPLRYPIFKKYPHLLPAISIVETSGGKNITYPNNPMNWGIRAGFVPASWEEAIEKAMTGIGERMPYYQRFRETMNLEDFVNVYAPPSENIDYLDKLLEAMSFFE